MSATINDSAALDWDVTIARAQSGKHAEEKLLRTAKLLTDAVQLSRLRGDVPELTALTVHLEHVHRLLDQV